MALAPFDLLAGIELRVAALRGASGALCIDDRCGRLGGLAHAVTPLLAQPIVLASNTPAAAQRLNDM